MVPLVQEFDRKARYRCAGEFSPARLAMDEDLEIAPAGPTDSAISRPHDRLVAAIAVQINEGISVDEVLQIIVVAVTLQVMNQPTPELRVFRRTLLCERWTSYPKHGERCQDGDRWFHG
jgi:hypothetical protein